MPSARYTIRPHNVASEVIEGEAIIVDVQSGTYFSANPSGSLLWGALLHSPHTREELSAWLQSSYPNEGATRIQADADSFLANLESHGLLARHTGDAPSTAPLTVLPHPHPYAAPALEVHTDMRDFLLVDPIHEVSDAGVPEPRER